MTNAPTKDTTTLAMALIAAQTEMPAVEPDSVNPHFESRFVSLGHLIAKVRPVLNRHDLAVTQYPSRDEDGTPTLVTILLHKSGERLESTAPLLLPKQDPQGQGSAITYMRRYALAAVLGISDQEDDDGNGASGEKPKAKAATNGNRAPAGTVTRLIETLKTNKVTWGEQKLILAAIGLNAPEECPKGEAAKALYSTLTADQAEKALKFLADAPKAAA